MRVSICAVGRLRRGPERDLIADYTDRFDKTGRSLGLRFGGVIEVEDRKGGGQMAEADLLRQAVPGGSTIWALDERGECPDSPGFARMLAAQRDAGQGDLAIMIGGADGLHPDLRAEARRAISLGAMVWPHMLARVMLSEQLYRAAAILAGTPYHRA